MRVLPLAALVLAFALAPATPGLADSHHVCGVTCEVPTDPDAAQFDGNGHGDAPDECGKPAKTLTRGSETTGALVAPLDTKDFYLLAFDANSVGKKVVIALFSLADAHDTVYDPLIIRIHSTDCAAVLATSQKGGFSCSLADCTVRADTISFLVPAEGSYPLEVLAGPGLKPVAFSPGLNACDPMCSRSVNLLSPGGYRVNVH